MERTVIPFISRTTTSISTLLDRKRTGAWPEPERSIGKLRATIKGKKCWEAKGPALEAFNKVGQPIQKLLDDRRDFLEEGEEITRPISYQIWMVGRTVESALPTIVFASKSKRSRTKATVIVKESDILAEFPGIAVKALSAIPAVPKADVDNGSQHPQETDEDDVNTIGSPQYACGAPIIVGGGRKATLGGILLVDGGWYGITANHARFGDDQEPSDTSEGSKDVSFDDDSDLEEDDFIEITSKGSVSSSASSDVEYDSSGSDEEAVSPRTGDISVLQPLEVPYPVSIAGFLEDETATKSTQRRKISTMTSPRMRNDIDYEIFPIEDARYCAANKIYPPSDRGTTDFTKVEGVAEELAERPVWVATGTTGTIEGVIQTSTHFIKMAGSQTFQEMWAVLLERRAVSGDCGSWVVDAQTGKLYGHVVADDPLTGLAYIIPAKNVFDDIRRRLGNEVRLPDDNVDAGHAISQTQLAERQCHVEKMSTISSAARHSLHLARKFSAICQTSSNTECTSATFEQGVKCSERLPLLVDVDEFETRNPLPRALNYSSGFYVVLNRVMGTGIFDFPATISRHLSQLLGLAGVLVSTVSILICFVFGLPVFRSAAFLQRDLIATQSVDLMAMQSPDPKTKIIATLLGKAVYPEPIQERPNLLDSCAPFDRGDITWMHISAAFVVLMAPGASIFYFGLAKRISAHSLIWLSLIMTAIVSFQWFFTGYSMLDVPVNGIAFVYHLLQVYKEEIMIAIATIGCLCFIQGSHSYGTQELRIKGTNFSRAFSAAFSGTVGIVLFLQSDLSPIAYMAVYFVAGTICLSVMSCLAEMTQLYPSRGRLFDKPQKFVDEGLGYTVGRSCLMWVLFFSTGPYSVIEYLRFHFGRDTWYWTAAWVLLLIVLSSMLHPTHHRIEQILGYIKMVCLCGIILSTIVLNALPTTLQEVTNAFNLNCSPTGAPRQSAFSSVGQEVIPDRGGTWLPIWIWISLIVFGWIGIEHYPVDKLEKTDLARHKSPLREARSAHLWCLLGYILACFSSGLNAAYQDSSIMDSVSNLARLKDRSPFKLAIQGRLRVWPNLLIAFAILSAISAVNTALYISSRILYSLARLESKWPRWGWTHAFKCRLRKTTNSGVPLCTMMTTLVFGGLGCQLLRTFAVQVSDDFKLAVAAFMLASIMRSYAIDSLNTDCVQVSFDGWKRDTRDVHRSWAGLGICACIVVVLGSPRTWVEMSNLPTCYLLPVICLARVVVRKRRERKPIIQFWKHSDGLGTMMMGTEDCDDDPDTGESKRETFRAEMSMAADELTSSRVPYFSRDNVRRVGSWVWEWLK